jgi:hypothetical protein
MIYQILGVILQIVAFVCLCRLGGHVCDRLWPLSKWAPLAVAGPIIVATVVVALVFQPAITFTVQTVYFSLVAFSGGIVARSQQRFTRG